MSRVFRLEGKLVEVSDEEILEAVKAEQNGYPEDLLSQIVDSCIMSKYIYSKASFDNAKDTKQMLAAAEKCREALTSILEYQIRVRFEELVIDHLSKNKDES